MSFHFAYPTNPDTEQTVSPYVSDMGLSLLRAKPSDINVAVFVLSAQPGYSSYVANLPYFIKATSLGRSLFIDSGCAQVALPANVPRLPWSLPPLIYDFPKRLNDRQVALLTAHSAAVTEGRSKNQTFIMKSPTANLVGALVRSEHPPSTVTRHVFGTVNLDALNVVRTLIDLTTAFVRTHNYPAFRSRDDLTPVEAAIVPTSPMRKKRKHDDTYLACLSNINENTEDLTPEEMEALRANTDAVPTIRLTTANPSDTSIQNWGTTDTIPNSEGLFVPYMKELSIADPRTVPDFITRYLAKCLGTNLQQVVVALGKLNTAWGIIRDTEIGNEMSHLYKCLDIAVRGQASVYPIFTNGVYEGAVIWGASFMVALNGRMYRPHPYQELQTLVQTKSMHSKSILDIKGLLGGMYDAEVDGCTSIRQLASLVQGVELSNEQRQTVIKLAHRLRYENKYWSVSPRYISMSLELLSTEDDIDDSIPMYPTMLFSTDRVEQVLSAFGYQAPTFLIPNGTTLRLEGASGKAPHSLHVRTVELSRAIADMNYVRQNGTITNNNRNLSAKHRDLSLNGPSKSGIWDALVDMMKSLGGNQAPVVAEDNNAGNVDGGAFNWEW